MQRIAAVVVTYNNAAMLESLLGDLLSQTLRPHEIIVIDNASSDSTSSVTDKFNHEIRYVRLPENIGSAGGFSEGIRLGAENNELLWTLDDDVTVSANALDSLVKWLDVISMSEKVGAVRSWPKEVSSFTEPKKMGSFAWRGTLITKSAINDAGLPKKEYFLYGEDTDYSLRIAAKGYSMFWIPETRVIEKRKEDKAFLKFLWLKASVYKQNFRLYYAFRNQFHLFIKHRKYFYFLKTLGYGAKVVPLLLLARQWSSVKAVLRGVLDGFLGRLGRNPEYIP